MRVGLRGSYVDVVFYMGLNEPYPYWFSELIYNHILIDEDRYTFYVPREERKVEYYEKKLIEDYSVFIRKSDGSVHVTDYDIFESLYQVFRTDSFENSGLAALKSDTIEYVECHGGYVVSGYPDWFYEYFSEAVNNPVDDETVFISDDNGDITITDHCVFLKNRYGEIKIMDYDVFLKYYDPDPEF